MAADLLIRKTAEISADGLYRYRLTRYWGPGEMLPFVMLNPSTADAEIDDPTIRRCMAFARRENYGGIVVVNLYACRATDPDKLRQHADPIGPQNGDAIWQIAVVSAANTLPVVCAWGTRGREFGGERRALEIMRRERAHLVCLGTTKEGHPRHPLYVKGNQPLVEYAP